MSIPTSSLRTTLLHAALFTATVASGAEVMFNTTALTTSEVTTAANWVGGIAPTTADIAAWKTDVDTVTAGNQESRGGTLTIASPVSWLGLRHEDSVGTMTLTGSDITLGASGITEVRWENLNIANNIVLGASQTWTATTTVTTTGVISGAAGLTKSGSGTLVLGNADTYTGPTAVAQGTIIATSLNKVVGGTASSSLGAPTTVADGTIALGGAGNQGILTYRGLGETTDRVINLSGTTGGATITADMGGLLKFTSPVTVTGAGAKGVTLNGGGLGELTGIPSSGGLTNLTKSGVGKWTLTGASTQTLGAVNMTGGTLAYTATASKTDGPINRASAATGVLEIASGASIVTSTGNTNGILGGWATVSNSTFAVANAASPIMGLATFTADTWAPGTNTNVTVAGANPASAAVTHSLRFNDPGSKTLTLAGTNAITSNGILITAAVGANPTTITGGTIATSNILNSGGATGSINGSIVVHQHDTAGEVTIASIIANAVTPFARTGSTTSGTAIVTGLSSTADLVAGMTVTGTGIAANSTISSINSATQITLSANTTATGTPSLTFGTTANPLVKAGAGTLVLSGANTYTGATNVNEGTLKVDAYGTAKIYNVSPLGTLQLGYNTGNSVYNNGVNLNSASAAATTGLYLKGGFSYCLQSGLNIIGAPATIRTVPSTGTVVLAGWDSNGTHLSVPTAASGSVLDQDISFAPGSYGYVMNIAAGSATATGDVTLQGPLTGATNANSTHFRKVGTGSLRLTGTSSNGAPLDIRDGTVFLSGGADRLGTGSAVFLGNGTTSGKLVLEGIDQTLANLYTVGTGTTNTVVGGSSTLSHLTINYTGAGQTLSAVIGGTGTNQNNLALGKGGTGTYTLTATNTYTGGTTITDGILSLGSAGAIGTTGTISLAGGTLQFSAANTTDYSSRIRIEDGFPSTIDTNGQNVTLASTLQTGVAGDGGLTKAGAGTLTLGGSNNYSGTTAVNAGILKLDYAASNTSKINNNALLKLGGGSVELSGGSHVELINSTELSAAGNVTITRSSGSSIINLGYLYRSSTGSLDLSAASIARTSLTNDGTGKLPAWITVAGQPAAVDGSGNIVAFSGFADVTRLGGKLPNNVNSNVRIVNGGTTGNITPLVPGLFNISTLLQNANAGPAIIDLAPSDTMRLGMEGAVLVPATSGALTIQGGALTAGSFDEVPGEIAVDADGTAAIASDILDNGAAPVTLSKSGSGALALSGSSIYTGGTVLTEGTLQVNSNFALGLGPITIAGGALDNTSGAPIDVTDNLPQTWDADFSFTGTNNLSFTAGTATLSADRAVTVAAGQIGFGTVAGGYNLAKNGPGALYIGTSTISGTTTVNAGVLEVQGRTGDAPYVITPTGTLKIGYTTGGGYANTNLKINGAGVAATTGLYLEGGTTYNGSGTIQLLTAPTTIRQFGTGNAGIGQFDINGTALSVPAVASGSVIDSQVEFVSRGYGMSVDIAVGTATTTGDLVMNGPLNINQATFGLYKRGAGSIALNAPATTVNAGVKILAGSVITGVDNALGENAILPISSGAKLVLNGHNQSAADLSGAGAVTNGNATPVELIIKQVTDQTFSGLLGGGGINDANFGLHKTGVAKLTLAGANNYIGNTTVDGGTLSVTTAFFADGADISIIGASTLDLATGTTDVVDQLIVDGVVQSPGIYGALGSGAQFERSFITGTGKLSVTTGASGDYNSWETTNGIAGAGSGTDSDADGISNGIEFVIGGDPSGPASSSAALLPTVTSDATYLNFVFRRSDASASYNPYVEYSSTMTGWTHAMPGVGGVIITEENDAFGAGTDRVTVKIPRSLAVSNRIFAHLRVDIP
ncbi:beta strand repeat-containing protein [Luteolibacter soli]|uniref:Autotransporter-associated beta strand repeat-containing protein n=1 Tax=Luteolibacter soli TaxID=3135280 RepID=A0ABU9AUC3_9BACT